jgi:hypothetical protein
MSDESSFSEIGSTLAGEDDDFTNVDDVNEESENNDSEQNIEAHQVIVELPPNGIELPQELQSTSGQESQVSSIASSFVRGVQGLNVGGAGGGQDSFVVVNVHRQGVDASVASSGWSLVSTEQRSSGHASTPAAGNQWESSSTTTSTTNYHRYQSSSDSSLGSLGSNFDIISLSSGMTVLRCKKCKFHNTEKSTVCIICGLALVANPCLDQDEQIARNLQSKEVNDMTTFLLERERKRERLQDAPPMTQATFLSEELQSCIYSFFDHGLFRSLPLIDLRIQAMTFIGNAMRRGAGTKVSIAYLFTASDDSTVRSIQRSGFQPSDSDDSAGEAAAPVSGNCSVAWNVFVNNLTPDKLESLFPIAENNDDMETLAAARGWLVAFSEFDGKDLSDVIRRVPYQNILPIAAFDAHHRDIDEVLSMRACIQSVCSDFFEIALHLDPLPKIPRFDSSSVFNFPNKDDGGLDPFQGINSAATEDANQGEQEMSITHPTAVTSSDRPLQAETQNPRNPPSPLRPPQSRIDRTFSFDDHPQVATSREPPRAVLHNRWSPGTGDRITVSKGESFTTEVYVRADGKKVRRVKINKKTSVAASTTPDDGDKNCLLLLANLGNVPWVSVRGSTNRQESTEDEMKPPASSSSNSSELQEAQGLLPKDDTSEDDDDVNDNDGVALPRTILLSEMKMEHLVNILKHFTSGGGVADHDDDGPKHQAHLHWSGSRGTALTTIQRLCREHGTTDEELFVMAGF